MYRVVLALVVLFALALPIASVELNVDYLEGNLEYRVGRNTWYSIEIGETIPEGSSIRLSNRGYAELTADGRRVTLTKDAIYESDKLIEAVPVAMNWRQLISSKFAALRKKSSADSELTVAAVRGAKSDRKVSSWEGDETDYLNNGLALLDSGDILGAKALFEKGSLWETGEIQRESVFRLALTQQSLNNPRAARRSLISINPSLEDSYLDEYTVVMATLYIESQDYAAADQVLSMYLDAYPNGEAAQAAWLLSSYSLQGQGNVEKSEVSLRKAVNQGAGTELGQAATSMLER